MPTYILKRLLLCIPMLIGISFISFFVMQMAPGEAGGGSKGEGGSQSKKMTADQRKVMYRTFHLNQPIHLRYFYWLGILQEDPTPEELAAEKHGTKIEKHGLLYGDFGHSMEIHSVKVWDRLADALPITIMLNVFSLLIVYALSIPLGVYSATHQDSWSDKIITVALFMLYSMPNFWVAVLLIKFDVMLPPAWRVPFQGIQPPDASRLTTLEWLYGSGKHLILPLIVMT